MLKKFFEHIYVFFCSQNRRYFLVSLSAGRIIILFCFLSHSSVLQYSGHSPKINTEGLTLWVLLRALHLLKFLIAQSQQFVTRISVFFYIPKKKRERRLKVHEQILIMATFYQKMVKPLKKNPMQRKHEV